MFWLIIKKIKFSLHTLNLSPVWCWTSQSTEYVHVGMVSSPYHAFFLGKLDLAVNQYFVHILSFITDNNPSWNSKKEENGRRNYFVINLHENIRPGRDQTCFLFVFLLYVPSQQLWSWQKGQFTLPLFFPEQTWTSREPVIHAHTFACNWQKPLMMIRRKVGEWR